MSNRFINRKTFGNEEMTDLVLRMVQLTASAEQRGHKNTDWHDFVRIGMEMREQVELETKRQHEALLALGVDRIP